MTREQWEAKQSKQSGCTAWNPDALYWRAFSDRQVTRVEPNYPITTGLWQDADVWFNGVLCPVPHRFFY